MAVLLRVIEGGRRPSTPPLEAARARQRPLPVIGRDPVGGGGQVGAQPGATDTRGGRIVSVTAAVGLFQQKCQKQRTTAR